MRFKNWSKLGTKGLWDLLTLAAIPVAIAVLPLYINHLAEKRQENNLQARSESEFMRGYIDLMHEIVSTENAAEEEATSQDNSSPQENQNTETEGADTSNLKSQIATALTHTTLKRVDKENKRRVIELVKKISSQQDLSSEQQDLSSE